MQREDHPGIRPEIALQVSGAVVVWKPPGWAVDDQDVGLANRLSKFIQTCFPESPVAHSAAYGYGFIHRLDSQCSGLLLAGTTFAGLRSILWQLDTFQVARDYVVICISGASLLLQDISASIWRPEKRTSFPATGRLMGGQLYPVISYPNWSRTNPSSHFGKPALTTVALWAQTKCSCRLDLIEVQCLHWPG